MSQYTAFQSKIAVRPDDIDMNQHVHNAKYFDYVLAARYDQMERCYEMSMEDFLERGYSWVVRSSYMEHKRPLHIGDTAIVETAIDEMRDRGVKVTFEIKKEADNKTVAKGWLDYVMVSVENGRPQTIPDDIVEKYSI